MGPEKFYYTFQVGILAVLYSQRPSIPGYVMLSVYSRLIFTPPKFGGCDLDSASDVVLGLPLMIVKFLM